MTYAERLRKGSVVYHPSWPGVRLVVTGRLREEYQGRLEFREDGTWKTTRKRLPPPERVYAVRFPWGRPGWFNAAELSREPWT